MAFQTLTDDDRAAIKKAAELIQGVLNRHPMEMSAPIILLAGTCVRDIELFGRAVEPEGS